MKRNFTYLMCAAGIACTLMAGCAKNELREAPQEMKLRPVTSYERGSIAETKADPELAGTTLGTDNTYVVYLSASGEQYPDYLTGQLYSYISGNSLWEASSAPGTAAPVFWPGTAALDFLGLACTPAAYSALAPAWDAVISANKVTITDWDVWTDQYDVMYAASNGISNSDNSGVVDMQFRHACALICFTAKGSVPDAYTINGITVNSLAYSGDFTVDNSYTNLSTGWSNLTTADKAVYGLDGTDSDFAFVVPSVAAQCAQHLLVPEQPAKSLTLTYTMGGAIAPLQYTIPLPRTVWKAGRKYTYALEFTPTEILASPTITDWDSDITEVVF